MFAPLCAQASVLHFLAQRPEGKVDFARHMGLGRVAGGGTEHGVSRMRQGQPGPVVVKTGSGLWAGS